MIGGDAIGMSPVGMPGAAFAPGSPDAELDQPGLEFTLPARLLHFSLPLHCLHFTLVSDDA